MTGAFRVSLNPPEGSAVSVTTTDDTFRGTVIEASQAARIVKLELPASLSGVRASGRDGRAASAIALWPSAQRENSSPVLKTLQASPGSRFSSITGFIQAVRPQVSVQRAGPGIKGIPSDDTVDRFKALNIPVYRQTAMDAYACAWMARTCPYVLKTREPPGLTNGAMACPDPAHCLTRDYLS